MAEGSKIIPTNAYKIIELRKRGYRPDEMILVSLIGKINELNHTVFAEYKKDYDWSWCRGLDICVYASSGVDWLKTIKSISESFPSFLAIWDHDRKEGAEFYKTLILSGSGAFKGHLQSKLDYMPWCSIQNKMFSGELCN